MKVLFIYFTFKSIQRMFTNMPTIFLRIMKLNNLITTIEDNDSFISKNIPVSKISDFVLSLIDNLETKIEVIKLNTKLMINIIQSVNSTVTPPDLKSTVNGKYPQYFVIKKKNLLTSKMFFLSEYFMFNSETFMD